MFEPDIALKSLAALVSLFFAILVASSGPRRADHLFLAGFLLLIAANQTVEALRAPVLLGPRLVSFRLATVFAALDPFVLYYFASIYPTRNRLNHPALVTLVLIPGAALAVAATGLYPHHEPLLGSQVTVVGWALYTAIVYTVILLHLGRAFVRTPENGSVKLLFLGMALATIPTWPRTFDMMRSVFFTFSGSDPARASSIHLSPWGWVWFLPPLLFAVGALLWSRGARHVPLAVRRQAVRIVWAGALFTSVLYVWKLVEFARAYGFTGGLFARQYVNSWDDVFNAGGTAIRWIVFGTLGSSALLKGRFLQAGLGIRRNAAWAVVGAGAGVLLAMLVAGAQVVGWHWLGTGEVVVLLVALAVSPPVHRLVTRVATALYGVPRHGDRAAAVSAYRAALAADEDQAPRRLERLRRSLALDVRTAGIVERIQAARNDPPVLEVGAVLSGRYRLTALLRRGAHGRVMAAHDDLLDRAVVVKELVGPPGRHDHALKEARMAGSLNHPNVVVLHDVLLYPDRAVLVLEHVKGESLAARVATTGPMPATEGIAALSGVLDGLAAVHREGIVHRDLSPDNILLAESGVAKITDFGTARASLEKTLDPSDAAAIAGTWSYMPPEQRAGQRATTAADVYAFGRVAEATVARPWPSAWEEAVEKALSTEVDKRPVDAAAFRDLIRRRVAGADAETGADNVPRRSRRRRATAGAHLAEGGES